MKCEYCESEVSRGQDGRCPCCGAELPQPEVVSPDATANDASGSLSVLSEQLAAQAADVQKRKCRELIRQLRANAARHGSFIASFASEAGAAGNGFIPDEGEIVCSVLKHVTLYESRAVSRSHTVKSGSSSYDYESESERRTDYEFQKVTDGSMVLTNKRLVFGGGQQVRNVKLGDVVTLKSYGWQSDGALEVSSSKRAKTMRFTDMTFDFLLCINLLLNPKLRQTVESGPEDEAVAGFVELGIYFNPAPNVREVIRRVAQEMDNSDIVLSTEYKFTRKWRNITEKIRERLGKKGLCRSDGIAIVDCTLFGSAKNGALIDETGIYMLNDGEEFTGFIDWQTFRQCGTVCVVGGDVVQICAQPKVGLYSLNRRAAISFFRSIYEAVSAREA